MQCQLQTQHTVTVRIIRHLLTETQIPRPHIFSFRSNSSGAIEGSQFKSYPGVKSILYHQRILYHHSWFMYLQYSDLK
jgi:hypothetical protein